MKGNFELPINAIILIVGLMGIFMLVVIVYAGIGTTARILEQNINQLTAVDAIHAVEACLTGGGKSASDVCMGSGNAISEACLDQLHKDGKTNACSACGICEIIIMARIVDLENGKSWEFTQGWERFWRGVGEFFTFWKGEPHTTNTMLVSLVADGGEIHMGRIYVEV